MRRFLVWKDKDEEDSQRHISAKEPTSEPKVPPPRILIAWKLRQIHSQSETTGSSRKGEVPASSVSSQAGEATGEKNIYDDDTAPKKKPITMDYKGQDIAGNEVDSVLRRLGDCFTNGYHGEWAGFYNHGYRAFQRHRHMFWHLKHRATDAGHKENWHRDSEGDVVTEYIRRH